MTEDDRRKIGVISSSTLAESSPTGGDPDVYESAWTEKI
jgi:hypothetical protein